MHVSKDLHTHTHTDAADHHDTHHSLCSSEPALRAQRKGQEAVGEDQVNNMQHPVSCCEGCEVTYLQSEDSKVTKVKDE